MSTSAYYGFAAHTSRKNSRKAVLPRNFLSGAAIACLVAGCSWTVYSNIFAAGMYPSVGGGDFNAVVVKRAPGRSRLAAVDNSVAVESAPVSAAPAMVSSATTSKSPSLSFEDRFAAAAPQSIAPQPLPAAPPKPDRQVAALAPLSAPERQAAMTPMPSPRPAEARSEKHPGASVRDLAQRAKAISVAAAEKPPTIFERLFGKLQSTGSSALAYASADASSTSSLGSSQNIGTAGTMPMYDRQTAVYDISAHMVYLPDGTRLEAHSGLGSKLDDPGSANVRMRGVTPPHLYDLKPREALFHGVPALRLNPVGGESAIYGRSGLLAHTYMLGPNGDSNGCVSFRDYNRFLEAYRSGEIRRLAVVARL
ncbi:DUF2778 domain-containing protein [Bradyrhizobium sp. dw_78]|uniref:DUF2778 domain-containing protein n=1 Tax=Bradyrhizobium sp. dw_78 TaxID=2719793 RepID=UPI001BD429CC|nr:DUF2778 domain-containing protein [Bradyrhizobium sp. dw_78]